MRHAPVLTLAVAAACFLAALPAPGQEPGRPSSSQIIDALKPAPPAIRTRSLRIQRPGQSEGSAPAGGAEAASPEPPPRPPSINLEVNFDFNSTNLTADARSLLDNLGAALNDGALKDSRFRITGHTDAKGGDDYNQKLSLERARAVAEYLDRTHGVTLRRLEVDGQGKAKPLIPRDPFNARNRRVEVVNIGAATP